MIDPITLEPVVTPAISPYGHVMGLATWNAVLAEQGKCPFTQQPLRRDQVGFLLFVHVLYNTSRQSASATHHDSCCNKRELLLIAMAFRCIQVSRLDAFL